MRRMNVFDDDVSIEQRLGHRSECSADSRRRHTKISVLDEYHTIN